MSIDPNIIEELEIRGLDILDSADLLTRQLAGKSQDMSSSALFLQIIFCLATIGVVLGIFWIIIRTLKPIRSLEYATSQIRQGNFDLELLKVKGNDELSNLSRSFNEMVESLKANDTMQKEFLSIASHELKTPIQSILGLVQGVKKGYINPDESFDRILRNIRRLQRLVDEILDVSRIESNALFLKMENVRVNKLIMDAVNKIKESLQYDDGITIEANLDTTRDIEINADANRITQVFVSVIGNAIKFTPKGTVRIETNFNHSRKTVEIIVTDNGDGIPEEIIPDLFNKFIAKSKDGNKHGIGLELYISKAIIDGHKGRISARNNGSGKSGSSMTIVLPMYDDHL